MTGSELVACVVRDFPYTADRPELDVLAASLDEYHDAVAGLSRGAVGSPANVEAHRRAHAAAARLARCYDALGIARTSPQRIAWELAHRAE